MNNIAEGSERRTDPEFSRFLDIAKSSCGEVRSMYYSAEDLAYLDSSIAEVRRSKSKKISTGIASLSKYLRKPTSQYPTLGLWTLDNVSPRVKE